MEGIINLVRLLIAITALVIWRARWACSRQRRVDMAHCSALILCALWAFSGTCLASDGAIHSAPQSVTGALPDLGIAIGDLDGDGRPEIAIVRSEGSGPKGAQYRIDLNLTAQALPSSFTVSAERGGLRIFPRDVDGDGDMDLVIMSAFLVPVSVWINDGHGGGGEGDPAAYPKSIWTEGHRIWVSNTSSQTFPATLLQPPRTGFDFPLSSLLRAEFFFDDVPLLPTSGSPQDPAVTGRSNRGPPQSSHNWPFFSLGGYCRSESIFGHLPILPATGSAQEPAVTGPSNRGPPPFLPPQSS